MLFRFLSTLAIGASSVYAYASPTVTAQDNVLNPPASPLGSRTYHPISQRDAQLTNAERLARRLPLKSPRRRNGVAAHPRPSGTPGSPGCTKGTIEVIVEGDSGKSLGKVRNTCNSQGEYGLTSDENECLIVCIDLPGGSTGPCDIKTENGPDSNLPFLGGITGYSSDCGCSNMNSGSPNYAYLGATVQTNPHAPASNGANSFTLKTNVVRAVQSAIFTYDNSTSILTPQWINEDGSAPATHLGYVQADDALILAGDTKSFEKIGSATWANLRFVPN